MPEQVGLGPRPSSSAPSGPPPSFLVGGKPAHFVDLQRVEVALRLDVARHTASVVAKIHLEMPEDGLALLDLDHDVSRLRLDGRAERVDLLAYTEDPDGESKLRVLNRTMQAGEHTLEVEYELPVSKHLSFDAAGVEFFQKATDLTPGYSEMFFPSNLQFDQYAVDMTLEVVGATREHRIFTNGDLTQRGDTYDIQFPPHFNTSSFYLHVTDPGRIAIHEDTFEGIEGPVPLTVYGPESTTVIKATEALKKVMAELEADYGAYDHQSFICYVDDDYRGGMEYSGATITSPKALAHEVFHSWFARGVMPAGGDAGWIDEALARWRDRGYPRAEGVTWCAEEFPQLTARTPWARVTQSASYEHGADVISEVDWILREVGGLKPILRKLFRTHRRHTIDTETFLSFIVENAPRTAHDQLRRIFARKLMGQPGASLGTS